MLVVVKMKMKREKDNESSSDSVRSDIGCHSDGYNVNNINNNVTMIATIAMICAPQQDYCRHQNPLIKL